MFRAVLLELFLPFRPFKKTANIRWTTTSAQILHENYRKSLVVVAAVAAVVVVVSLL